MTEEAIAKWHFGGRNPPFEKAFQLYVNVLAELCGESDGNKERGGELYAYIYIYVCVCKVDVGRTCRRS